MSSKQKAFLLIAGLSILCACRKEGSTGQRVWEGRVLEYGSDEPVAGARVYLWEGTSEWWGQSSQYRIDSTESAADGSFRFTYERVGGRYYRITGSAEQYYPGEAFLERTSSTKADLVLDPYAWVKVEVKNINPVDQNDAIRIEMNSCEKELFKGEQIDDYTICQTWGNREVSFYYSVTKIGREWVRKQVKCAVGSKDTTSILIEY